MKQMVKKYVMVIVMCLVVLHIFTGCTSEKNDIDKIKKETEILTPYCTLEFPKEWQEYMTYKESEDKGVFTENFYCSIGKKQARLFAVHFGETSEGELLGNLKFEEEMIPIYIEIFTLSDKTDWTDEEKNIIAEMTEAVNEVIQSIKKNKSFSEAKDTGERGVEYDYIEIETPYCTLKFPDKWEQYLEYEINDENSVFSIEFFANIKQQKKKIFTVNFGDTNEKDGVGYIKTEKMEMPVSVKIEEIVLDDSWTEKEKDILYAMGECVNDVIQSIVSDEAYESK